MSAAGADRRTETERIETALSAVAWPPFVKEREWKLDYDWAGDKAIWVSVVVSDFKEIEAHSAAWSLLPRRIREALATQGLDLWAFLRVKDVIEQPGEQRRTRSRRRRSSLRTVPPGSRDTMGVVPRPLEAKPLKNFCLWLRYDDGTEGEVDLADLAGRGVFRAWNEPGVFETVHVSEHGSIAWSGDLELCPDALYMQLTGKKPAQVFPRLNQAGADA